MASPCSKKRLTEADELLRSFCSFVLLACQTATESLYTFRKTSAKESAGLLLALTGSGRNHLFKHVYTTYV